MGCGKYNQGATAAYAKLIFSPKEMAKYDVCRPNDYAHAAEKWICTQTAFVHRTWQGRGSNCKGNDFSEKSWAFGDCILIDLQQGRYAVFSRTLGNEKGG